MWVMLNDAMFSIVESKEHEDILVVRARRAGDIEKVFTQHSDDVIETEDSDYRFRIFCKRLYVSTVMVDEVNRINYPNFKNSVVDEELSVAYNKCWIAMYSMQQGLYPDHRYLDRFYRL